MAPVWILIFSLYNMYSAQTAHLDETVSLVSADLGHAVTLRCTLAVKSSDGLILWYKHRLGGIPQAIGMIGPLIAAIILPPFNQTNFQLDRTENIISLNILHVTKDDEAMYLCGKSRVNIIEFSSGTFLSVKDKPYPNVSVLQSSALDSVPAGASVTLQCSVLSESRAADLQVLWFRAAPPQSHPQIIYTHHNSSHQCESSSSTHTCVYSFSKNILSLNDTGTYYCAVAVCGKIIFGNGTRVQLDVNTFTQRFKGSDSVVICLAVTLAVCVVVIFAQAILSCKKIHLEQNRVKLPQGALIEKTHNQDRDAVELNYAALNFSQRKIKSGRAKKRQPQDTVYSEVIHTPVT